MKEVIRRMVPRSVWRQLAGGKNWLLDALEGVGGLRDPLVPPRRLQFVGAGDFKAVGSGFAEHFVREGGLKRLDHVLDVGCGIGRMAVPLTAYLAEGGSYDGIDIVPHGIAWCQQNITSRFPKFRFQLADIRNNQYNPEGQFTAADFHFPFSNEAFDFIFLTSVFTHMLPMEVDNYLSEVSRMLKPGGRCFITWYLLNQEAMELVRNGRAVLDFKHAIDGCFTTNLNTPEEAIAYAEEEVVSLYQKHGLASSLKMYYGAWCGRRSFLTAQDVCIVQK